MCGRAREIARMSRNGVKKCMTKAGAKAHTKTLRLEGSNTAKLTQIKPILRVFLIRHFY